ncbi:flavodoxin domain-containing protein [Seleniivibrio woodruffii]|uniref:Menaquinone-dependent protoporphyrinogen oxidase n=1 Tax=Seleniivibrio woodruffii TaxID=1078050 RepID=A0A4R1K605_9BACT|nr:flavodoxin domain-containing protein [Seleniivibrio woodruffii]TCK58479.1 menaquinone-dependent protoporphyrinogen oxidase [Seleniivibrio woodruffii]TVZ36852.1 menaquinone-dependent protoporphyrinogen oxidase [Seleniivibrio woodruffii]
MTVKIVYGSRYGSTRQISEWISERFEAEGFAVATQSAADASEPGGCDLVLLGSGIYNHGFLKELEEYMEKYSSELQTCRTALFGVAMKTEPIMHKGKSHGGILMLEKYAQSLGDNVVGCGMLHGQMVFPTMTDRDKKGIEQFYKMIGLSETEAADRKKPRTLMDKRECWTFAEELIGRMAKVKA